jgi:hypothetical protein
MSDRQSIMEAQRYLSIKQDGQWGQQARAALKSYFSERGETSKSGDLSLGALLALRRLHR